MVWVITTTNLIYDHKFSSDAMCGILIYLWLFTRSVINPSLWWPFAVFLWCRVWYDLGLEVCWERVVSALEVVGEKDRASLLTTRYLEWRSTRGSCF